MGLLAAGCRAKEICFPLLLSGFGFWEFGARIPAVGSLSFAVVQLKLCEDLRQGAVDSMIQCIPLAPETEPLSFFEVALNPKVISADY